MHKWNKSILILMITGMLIGAAAPAHAQQVPFNVHVPVPGTGTIGIGPMNQGSGFIGACDPLLQCTGASMRVAHTEGEAEVGGVEIWLTGAICVLDSAAPCGAPGNPGTGVVFTRHDLYLGTSHVDVPDFELEVCIWEQDPRFAPSNCQTLSVRPRTLAPVESQFPTLDLGQFIPDRVVVSAVGQT